MTGGRVVCGFVPLVDCASLVVARELGFAAEEGVDLVLAREPSWSNIRDKVSYGIYPAAHMLAPMPLAMAAAGVAVDAPFVLCVNGTTVGVAPALARAMAVDRLAWGDAGAMAAALLAQAALRPLRFGVPFPRSMHLELLRYWLERSGGDAGAIRMVTVPPPVMAQAMAAGEIDGFCVGEPWGSRAVELGAARVILAGAAIWRFAPEKVLGLRRDWAAANPATVAALIRALWRAARWIGQRDNLEAVAEILGRPAYLDLAPEIIERSLTGRLVVDGAGRTETTPRMIEFHDAAATFPWRSQEAWIAARCGLAMAGAFRPDLYRQALGPIGVDLPGASAKVEGALDHRMAVASSSGEMFLGPDSFFDRATFDFA